MASKTQLCNLALVRLGANTVVNIATDSTSQANLCNILFDDLADEVMAEGSWTSTIRRVALAQTTNTPAFGYTYEYQLPVDPKALKILEVNHIKAGDIDYAIEDDKLLTDNDTISIRYVARLTDTEDWDIYLQRAFVARLASELAYPLTGDDRKAQLEFERYRIFVQEGLALNGQQGSKQQLISDDLIDVR
jgi:hypothetical protein